MADPCTILTSLSKNGDDIMKHSIPKANFVVLFLCTIKKENEEDHVLSGGTTNASSRLGLVLVI